METRTMKHTPAPWIIYQPDKFVLSYSFKISEMTNGKEFSITSEEAEANRILMQAAPETAAERNRLKELNKELTETLERALNDFRTGHWTDETYDIIESAIAKSKSL